MEYISEAEGRSLICEIGRRMYGRGFVAANDGNISVLIGKNEVLCTPTGVSKGFMSGEDLIVIDRTGNKLRGKGEPSSEMKLHLKIYELNETAKAVVHAHPVNATALSVAGLSLEKPILTESVVSVGPVPLAPYATAGTDEVPEAAAPYCKDYKALLLANHGAVTWDADLMKAWYRMESLEQSAEIFIKAEFVIGKVNYLDDEKVRKLKERYE